MCQLVLIYAFDEVNLQMEPCRQAAPLAARYFDVELFAEEIQ